MLIIPLDKINSKRYYDIKLVQFYLLKNKYEGRQRKVDQISKNEDKMSYYQYENISMLNEILPVNIQFRKSNHNSLGCEFHWHEELEFYYVKKGAVLLQCNGREQWIKEGQVGFVNWCQLHRGSQFLDGTEHYIIQIGTEFFSAEIISYTKKQKQCNYLSMLIAYNQQFPVALTECKDIIDLLEKMISLLYNQGTAYQLRLKAAVYNLLAVLAEHVDFNCLLKDSKEYNTELLPLEHVKKILFFLSENYMYPDKVALPELSHHFGLSIPYLCRIFKQYTNMTVTTYLHELRCNRAASFIQKGTSLEETAYLTGFQDYNYFSKIFKRVIGMSPRKYKALR